MSTPESIPTHLPWATLCQRRPLQYARSDFIPQSGTFDLASEQQIQWKIALVSKDKDDMLETICKGVRREDLSHKIEHILRC
jgi:hypothetical protein